jgi:DNA modification methylase
MRGGDMGKRNSEKIELIWPGKYNDADAPPMPSRAQFLLVLQEQISAAGDEALQGGAWRNKLIWGDNLSVMAALQSDFAGAIDLIYIDPPFATGSDFFLASQERAYRDTWSHGLSEYLSMLWPRLHMMYDLLSPTGSMYVHIGWEVSAYVQLLLNEIFGEDCLQNVIIYNYGKFHHSKKRWKRDFDVILFYSKHPQQWTFNHGTVLDAYQDRTEIRFDKVDEAGRRYKIVKGRRVYHQGGVTPSGVWRLSNLQRNAVEAVGYPTQKTEELLTRIIAASSKPGDVVADFFCGSGVMLVAAEKLDRRWIGCDLGQPAVQMTRQRLIALPPRRPFDIFKLEEN